MMVWADACRLTRTCPCSKRTEMAWPQVEQWRGIRSLAASWNQPERTLAGSSLQLICQAVRSNCRLVSPRKQPRRWWRRPFCWMLERRPCSEDDSFRSPLVLWGRSLDLEGVQQGHGGRAFSRSNLNYVSEMMSENSICAMGHT